MTGLPQGVTLPGVITATTVQQAGRVIGSVAMAWAGGWHAWANGTQANRVLRSKTAAVRWVCLQARPVVYQVRRERDAGAWFRWSVRDERGQACDFYPDQVNACRMADALARADLAGVTR